MKKNEIKFRMPKLFLKSLTPFLLSHFAQQITNKTFRAPFDEIQHLILKSLEGARRQEIHI